MSPSDGHILVTGAAGMIGRHLIEHFSSRGLRTRAVIHRRQPAARLAHVKYVTADLAGMDNCARVMQGIDYVFHCAAVVVGASATSSDRTSAVAQSAVINARVIEAAYQARVKKFLWLGSTTAYPAAGNRPLREEEILDGQPFEKYHAVGGMNRQMEMLCRHYGQDVSPPMTTIVLRPTNVYGPGDNFDPATSRVAAALVRRVVERHDPLVIWGTGDDVRDMIYAADVVRAMGLAMEQLDRHAELNIGTGRAHSVREMLETLLDLEAFKPSRVEFDAAKPSMIPVRLVDVSKAQRDIGFVAEIDLREGFRRTLQWYKQNHSQAP